MALPEVKVRITGDASGATKAANQASGALDQLSASQDRVRQRSGAMGRGIQNAAFQIGDFAVQVGAGTQASKALAMQLPQLLGGFGILGAVMGATVAIAVPLINAMREMKFEGAGLTGVFGTLQPAVDAMARGFQALGGFIHSSAELLINNVDRILITAGTAAAFFGGKWVVSFVAARVATFSLSAALVTLRAAIIRTGIGALIVGAGELVYQFTRLAKGAGGFGNALGMLADVGVEVWQRMGDAASSFTKRFQAIIANVKAAFLGMLSELSGQWSIFLGNLSQGVAAIPGAGGIADALNAAAAEAGARMLGQGAEASAMKARAGRLNAEADELAAGLGKPLESVQKIRDLLAGMKDEKITLPDVLGVGDDEGGGGKKKSLSEKLSDQEKRIKDHLDRIRALTKGTLSDKLGAWGGYFDNLVSMTGSSNQKLLGIGKAFASAQALMDSWKAYTAVLADPSLVGRPFARIAAAGQVLAAGLGAVNAIKSVTGAGSGGGGAAGVASAATSASGDVGGSRQVAIQLTGGDMFSKSQVRELINALNEEVENGAILRLV